MPKMKLIPNTLVSAFATGDVLQVLLIGNCVTTVAVAAWEGDIDRKRAHAVLDGLPVGPLDLTPPGMSASVSTLPGTLPSGARV